MYLEARLKEIRTTHASQNHRTIRSASRFRTHVIPVSTEHLFTLEVTQAPYRSARFIGESNIEKTNGIE